MPTRGERLLKSRGATLFVHAVSYADHFLGTSVPSPNHGGASDAVYSRLRVILAANDFGAQLRGVLGTRPTPGFHRPQLAILDLGAY